MTQFYGKTKICYGEDAMDTLEHLTARQAFIVTDKFMVKAGFVDRVISHLDRKSISHLIFDEVESDPSLETVIKGVRHITDYGGDLIIALGGGSPIDAAKAIAFFASKASENIVKPTFVAIPTTSGTGSEVTGITVITDKVNEIKIPIRDESLIPDIAILDARFTRTLPPHVTAATGMDVLTHAIEAYTARGANAFTSIYAKYAIRYVFDYLFRAYRNGDDMEAREHMLLGSCMAGMAFNNSGLGLTHSIAHSLGGIFHVPHGLANAVLLPHVIRFNGFDVGIHYQEIAALLALPSKTVEEGTDNLIQAVRNLNESLGIPNAIGSLKIKKRSFYDHLDDMANKILDDLCTEGNPRRPSKSDIIDLLRKAW